MERTTEQSVAVIESNLDQMCAKWYERAQMSAMKGLPAEAFCEAIDSLIEVMERSDHPETRLLGELAQIGWCHVLTRWGDSALRMDEGDNSD